MLITKTGEIKMDSYLLRSLLYVPAYSRKYIESSLKKNADAIIIDLEDSVPSEYKQEARKNITYYLQQGKFNSRKIFIRLNSIDSKLLFEDLICALHKDVNGFLLTKINSAADLDYYDKLITQLEHEHDITNGHFRFLPLIETTSAVMDVYNIAKASKRNIGLCFGGEDFLQDLEGLHGQPAKAFDYPRAQISIAARSAGIWPIDTPFLDFEDREGFVKEETASFEMGFAGIQLVHPSQIELAHKCFMPSEYEIKKSIEIVESVKKAETEGSGVAVLNGKMIGPPMKKRAEKVLNMVELSKKV